MQLQCKPEPYSYRVCLRTIRIAEDIVDDPHFSGYMQIIIRGVPPVTDKADNEVMENDLRTWVLYGLKEEHPQVSGRKYNARLLMTFTYFLCLLAYPDRISKL